MSAWGRVVSVPLSLEWSESVGERVDFEREFALLSDLEDDPVGQWLKLAKAKGEAKYSDELALKLLATLHQKIDHLTRLVQNEKSEYLQLECKTPLEGMGHEVMICQGEPFIKGRSYYGRINLPVFPQRVVPLFFEALEGGVAKVVRIHERDQKDWDTYIASRERAIIRESKGVEHGSR